MGRKLKWSSEFAIDRTPEDAARAVRRVASFRDDAERAEEIVQLQAVRTCTVQGLSVRQTAKVLGLAKSTIGRIKRNLDNSPQGIWTPGPPSGVVAAELARRGQALTTFASLDHITEAWKTPEEDGFERIRDEVRESPGSVISRLPIGSAESPWVDTATLDLVTLRDYADDAQCMVDATRNWWPRRNVRDLQPGDEVPRFLSHFESDKTFSWVFIEAVTGGEDFDGRCTVKFQEQDGTPGTWTDCAWDEPQPVRSWTRSVGGPAGFISAAALDRLRVLITLHGQPEAIASAHLQGHVRAVGYTGLILTPEDTQLVARFVQMKMDATNELDAATTPGRKEAAARKLQRLLGAEVAFPTDIVKAFFGRVKSMDGAPWSEYLEAAAEFGFNEHDCRQLVATGRWIIEHGSSTA
ncbi:helix-turn-helix domain-containing protein [Rhodococcus qingshengii]|uniref:helix-turn-helix domain-containing protein n=1 Tax=Rhodococcus qingshengii TaxID=334542 RepID=UPI001AE2F49C|nr:helix-turn-helix domain-containing protein [Rhodococcus qingshengii]MBP1054336.1 helix-turn-helix domain-containing protein [Rhodococcus qingshengii]